MAACTERKLNPPFVFVSKSPSEIRNVLLSGGNVTYVYLKVAMPMLCLGKLYSFRIIITKDGRERIKDWMRYYLKCDVQRYILRRGVITRSQFLPCSYSHLPRAIISCDKCNLHIICRVPSKDRLRRTTALVPSLAGIRYKEFLLDIERKRERDSISARLFIRQIVQYR